MAIDKFLRPSGELADIKSSDGSVHKAFIPAELPVKIEFDNETLSLLEEASRNLGKLDGIGRYLSTLLNINIRLFIKPYLSGEAVLSSKIEGTRSTLLDVLNAEMEEDKTANGKSEDDLFEVLNYVNAQGYGIECMQHSSISIDLIKDLHGRLLRHVRGEKARPGSFREVQNYISKYQTGHGIEHATYIPPPNGKVLPLLENLVDYMEKSGEPPLIKIALMHYQFEAIHPFLDGNGRIGRLLIILYLIKEKVLEKPLLYMSEYFEANRSVYYSLLLEVSKNSAYSEWIKFFLIGVSAQAKQAVYRMESMAEYYEEIGGMIKNRYSKSTFALFQLLFSNPIVTLPYAAQKLGLKYPTVKQAAKNLIDVGVLREMEKNRRPARFIAEALYRIYTSSHAEAKMFHSHEEQRKL